MIELSLVGSQLTLLLPRFFFLLYAAFFKLLGLNLNLTCTLQLLGGTNRSSGDLGCRFVHLGLRSPRVLEVLGHPRVNPFAPGAPTVAGPLGLSPSLFSTSKDQLIGQSLLMRKQRRSQLGFPHLSLLAHVEDRAIEMTAGVVLPSAMMLLVRASISNRQFAIHLSARTTYTPNSTP